MTFRVIVRPDKDDVIRFMHEGELIEVTVDRTLDVAQTSNQPPPKPHAPQEPVLISPTEIPPIVWFDPGKIPHPYFAPKWDGEAVSKEVERLTRDVNEITPKSIVVRSRELDLSTLKTFAGRIAQSHPELPICVDLSGFEKL